MPDNIIDRNGRELLLNSDGSVASAGNVASGAADSGNPQKIGGVFNTTLPTVTNGQRVDAQFTSRGLLLTAPGDASGQVTTLVPAAGVTATRGLVVASFPHLSNGTTSDPVRGNVETGSLVTVTTSSANGADQTNYNGTALIVVVDITAFTGTNIVFTIEGKDPTSGKYYTLLASAALTGTGTTVLKVGRGLTAAANTVANDLVPRTFRVKTTCTAVTAITATCAGILLV